MQPEAGRRTGEREGETEKASMFKMPGHSKRVHSKAGCLEASQDMLGIIGDAEDNLVIALRNYCTKTPKAAKPCNIRRFRQRPEQQKFCIALRLLHCYEVTFVNGQFWQTYLPIQTFSTALGKSSDLTVSGIGHSVIRGLVTNRLMVRREPCYLRTWITVSCANIVQTQMARTLQ